MNKIPSHSLLKGGLTALLICAMSVVDQAKMNITHNLELPQKIDIPVQPIQKVQKNMQTFDDVEEMSEQYETYCEIKNATMLYDSLLNHNSIETVTTTFNRKEYQDSLFQIHPEAKEFKAIIKTGTYLREAKQNYLQNKDALNALFSKGWGYSRYQKFNRDLTQYGWKTGILDKNKFLFVNDTYITFLITFMQKNPEFKPVVTRGSKDTPHSTPKPPPSGMFAMVRDTIREQTISVGGKDIYSKHYPHQIVYDAISNLGHSIYSSKDGEITRDTPDCFEGGCTALTGAQLDILIPGLEGLRQKIWEELEKIAPGSYTIKDIIYTLRAISEGEHTFGINPTKTYYIGIIGGQLYPKYNNVLKIGGQTNVESGTLNNINQLYCTHGRGTTVDISIDCKFFWIIKLWVKQLPKIKIGVSEYNILDLGNGYSALLLIHGHPKKKKIPEDEDLIMHLHVGFIPNVLMK